ncbi:MAG TPA: DUF6249 domain-containing protein [Ktedonobacterales bacterium]|jgi:hypothetical protein|nr:DUF6249 domain-containing protein [Ktedonobacterales bacterium]
MNDLAVVGLEWLGGLALFLGFILLLRYLEHRERMSLIERGLLPSIEGPGRPRYARGSAVLRGGLITAMVGFAVTIGLYTLGYLLPPPFNAAPGRLGPWLLPGLIPMAVGLALIASYYLSPPRPEPLDDASAADPSAETGMDSTSSATRRPGWRVLERAAGDDTSTGPRHDLTDR